MGAALSGSLFAHPPGEFAAVTPVGWDAERDLVVVEGGSAFWASDREFDRLRDVSIWMSWHSEGVPGVEVSGTVSRLLQTYVGPNEHCSPRRHRAVDVVEKFPEPIIDSGLTYEPGSVVVMLTDPVIVEPTRDEVVDFRRRRARGRRTLIITAPAPCFGPTVPFRDARVSVDLDDPTVDVSPHDTTFRGIVSGIATQVSVAQIVRMTGDAAVVMPAPVPAGTPAHDLLGDLFVVLVLDEDT